MLLLFKKMKESKVFLASCHSLFLLLLVLFASCSSEKSPSSTKLIVEHNESSLNRLAKELSALKKEQKKNLFRALENGRSRSEPSPVSSMLPLTPRTLLEGKSTPSCSMDLNRLTPHAGHEVFFARHRAGFNPDRRIRILENKLFHKRTTNSIVRSNQSILSKRFEAHTELRTLHGKYHVLVVPVQFRDVKFEREEFFRGEVQNYLFGKEERSLSTHYLHSSAGKLRVTGEVAPVITVDGTLADYGEAVIGGVADKAPRELVVQALLKLKEIKRDSDWWESFDNWDLFDYDMDKHHREPDGFIDAVVLIYAGKSQASCQSAFDQSATRPPSADVPPGPRREPTVECFNRIWPHRWSISLSSDDPNFSSRGPIMEGITRSSFNGLKITDRVFALDYNMQSEYSDRSTFIHELGHSLTLPDIYDTSGRGNSSGLWEVMSNNAFLDGQEFSTYSKISLGWIKPKIIKQGQNTTAYLAPYNFITHTQREDNTNYEGPEDVLETQDGEIHSYNISSVTPGFGEPVYQSLAILTEPSKEELKLLDMPKETGSWAAYSGRFDGQLRRLKLRFSVPETGDATLSFDEYHFIETETNILTREEEIKVIVDYDIGQVLINGELQSELRTVSGDQNADTLNESNPECKVSEVLALRLKIIRSVATDAEKSTFQKLLELCQKPTWQKLKYDLSHLRGQEVEFELSYLTDAAYTEMGIVVDNFKLGDKKFDFESAVDREELPHSFVFIKNGIQLVEHEQLYLIEYRDPQEMYLDKNGNTIAYNKDNNISVSNRAMFLNQTMDSEIEDSFESRFRVFTLDYQPGVLVWYFNSKYGRNSNSPIQQGGQGYLLVLHSKVQELYLPGVFSDPELLNARKEYDLSSPLLQLLVSSQRNDFMCFSAIDYYTYLNGVAPNCRNMDPLEHNKLNSLLFNGKQMVDGRQGINELLPVDRKSIFPVSFPSLAVTSASARTAAATFRPQLAQDFSPFKVYKVLNGEMVLDESLTNSSMKLPPVSEFRDAKNVFPESERFQGDTVLVEKRGLQLRVANPSSRIQKLYSMEVDPDNNEHYFRRPRVKVIINWD